MHHATERSTSHEPCRARWRGKVRALVTAAALAVVAASASTAEASHFRFAHNTWTLVAGTTVEFTSTQAWRTGAGVSALSLDFGDGFADIGPVVEIGTFADLAGEQYTITQYKVQHTYGTEGPYIARISNCCRISTLVNAADASLQIDTIVDLRGGNTGSPVSSIPVVVQIPQGAVNNIVLPIADPDGDPFTCRMGTYDESFIPVVASAGGNDLAVSPNCILSWNTSAAVIGNKFAAQVEIEEDHGGNIGRVALDFIVEIVGNRGTAPDCAGVSGNHIVNVGQPFAGNFTGTDVDGDNLTISHLGLPGGATLTPPSGTNQPQPFDAVFDWTPQPADAGSAHAITIVYTDVQGLQGTCAFSINVPASACGNGVIEPPFEQCDDENLNNGDGCDANCQVEVAGACCDAGLCVMAFGGLCPAGTYQGDGTTCQDPGICTFCGDGYLTTDEQCDDGNLDNGDGCDANCQLERVGACCAAGNCFIAINGVCEIGTYQGDGTTCDDPGICTFCGDGYITGEEQCDDANQNEGDGCDTFCRVETCWSCTSGPNPTLPAGPALTPPAVPGFSVCTPDTGTSCEDGDACTVGDTCSNGLCGGDPVLLQAACRWVMVGDDGVQSRTRGQTSVTGHICGWRARIGEFSTTNGDVVATRDSSTAIEISGHAAVTGDIVSDGGAVSGKPFGTLLPGLASSSVASGNTAVQSGDPSATYDTTGDDTRTDDCIDAQQGIADGETQLDNLPNGTDMGDEIVPAGATLPLPAANPGALNVFDFRKLITATDATIVLDAGGNPDTLFVLRVQKKLDLRLRTKVILAGGAQAGNVILYSQERCRFGLELTGAGTVFCPNGKLIMNARANWQGALIGGRRRVELRDSGVLIHVPLQVGP